VGTHGNVTKDSQQDVDKEVGVAAALEEHSERRQHNGEDDLADIAVKAGQHV
jgi:triosephosphate isomerase